MRRLPVTPPAPYAAVEAEVLDPGDGVTAGLAATSGDSVLTTYDPVRGRATIEVRVEGRTREVAHRRASLSGPFRFAFTLCESRVTALADDGSGWRPLVTTRDPVARLLDLTVPQVLSTLGYAFGALRADGVVRLGGVSGGSFGMVGVRDIHLVQHPDGTPHLRDGKLLLTMTCAGFGGFSSGHWGVFALDPDSWRLEQVAQLFFARDGRVLGDHAGQILVDQATGKATILVSSWGDFDPRRGVHVRSTTTTDAVLGGVHVLPSERFALPTTLSTWDPALTRIDDRWHVGYVESPSQQPFEFRPALAVGAPGGPLGGPLTRVGADETSTQCEGPILSSLDGGWRLLASDGGRREYPEYDLSMRRCGRLDAPYLSNIPHPQVVQLPDGRRLLVTFDGSEYGRPLLPYGTHGDLVVMVAG